MSTDFNKNEFGQNQKKTKRPSDVLVGKFCRLRYESLGKDYYNQNKHDLEQYGNLHIDRTGSTGTPQIIRIPCTQDSYRPSAASPWRHGSSGRCRPRRTGLCGRGH